MTRTALAAARRGNPPDATDRVVPLTPRRRLQLALAGLWVLDGLLKLQPFMFTKDFAPMTLGDASEGAPGWLASPINWASGVVEHHPVGLMVLFALVELVIGFGIAWTPTLKPALLACVLWVPFLWFFAEGLGGLASGAPSAFSGAPGASILYGLLAVLLWPTERNGSTAKGAQTPSGGSTSGRVLGEAGRYVGTRPARIVWIVLWGLLAVLAFLPVNRSADAFSDVISGVGQGAPTWYVTLLDHATAWTLGRGGEFGIVFGLALVLVALSVLAPRTRPQLLRAGIVLALVLSALIWVFGEGFGMPFMGMGTDPDTGPLLALLALAFWPSSTGGAAAPAESATAAVAPEASGTEGAAA
jgi:hypothetical protein